MAIQRISDQAVKAIRQDNELGLAVCNAMGVKLSALPSYLERKSIRLTLHSVVKIIADNTGFSEEEILEDAGFIPQT